MSASRPSPTTGSIEPDIGATIIVNGQVWQYQQCLAASRATRLTLVESSSAMTVEKCLVDCGDAYYAGIRGP